MPPERPKRASHRLQAKVSCQLCQKEFSSQGITAHERACRRKDEHRQHDLALQRREQDIESESSSNDEEQGVQSFVRAHNEGQLPFDGTGLLPLSANDDGSVNEAIEVNDSSQPHPPTDEPPAWPAPFFTIQYHPSSSLPPSTISLDNASQSLDERLVPASRAYDSGKPWLPFKTRGDFEFCHFVVSSRLSVQETNTLLRGMHQNRGWTSKCTLSFKTWADIQDALAQARPFFPQFRHEIVKYDFEGKQYSFTLTFRDPWEWIESIVCDPTLAHEIQWYPYQKFYHEHGKITRVYDELMSGDACWAAQDSISTVKTSIPRCYLPIHYWSDKGKVSGRVSKYPVVLRPGFLPASIRNGSGNGGGVIIAYIPVPVEYTETKQMSSSEQTKHATRKRTMVHAALEHLFRSLVKKSHQGEPIECGDTVVRILFPGIPIISADYEEATTVLINRGVRAKHPDGSCDVLRTQLHDCQHPVRRRTVREMMNALSAALSASTITARDEILKEFGTYIVKNAFWPLKNSDPYLAFCLEILHVLDLGLAKRIFSLLIEYITGKDVKLAERLNEIFASLPIYPDLKKMHNVTGIEFTDGNTMLHIMKCLVYCLANLLPKNSPWVHLVRAYSCLRLVLGFKVMTEGRLALAEQLLTDYQKCTEAIPAPATWDFFKQHILSHALADVRLKGATHNYSARPGEGMIQEVKQAYEDSNGKNVEVRMALIDQDQEIMAQMNEWLKLYDKQSQMEDTDSDEEPEIESKLSKSTKDKVDLSPTTDHHALGSPIRAGRIVGHIEREHPNQPEYSNFLRKLSDFIALGHHNLDDCPPLQGQFFVHFWKCAYINYISCEDWLPRRDIIRCNPNFQGNKRFDTVLVNDTPLRFARVLALFTWRYHPAKKPISFALVRYFQDSTWKPKTPFKGMRILKERKESHFIYVASIIRSCHMPQVPDHAEHYFMNDTIDADMYLRMNSCNL
ncbi:hypothetical protein SISSUDRAFT_1016075 [Sistotremastrum suecicum HHB10207 ss-3]|uniref:C2H2-type domain-containing protein n=1 Tax=Sistotremastrum suecicum HHB10207 ss-3 TaxID=1314776 RepID=A0A166H3E2_9AGAM|nr:hypothetical protein SISSUDRAFT_1016075 [Sistotremastrum suecicum HHB10207 ss-3]